MTLTEAQMLTQDQVQALSKEELISVDGSVWTIVQLTWMSPEQRGYLTLTEWQQDQLKGLV